MMMRLGLAGQAVEMMGIVEGEDERCVFDGFEMERGDGKRWTSEGRDGQERPLHLCLYMSII